jgi:hypothetical protein
MMLSHVKSVFKGEKILQKIQLDQTGFDRAENHKFQLLQESVLKPELSGFLDI